MKKVLSFVLSVAMVICLMPAMAFAADDAAATTATATGLSQFSDKDSIRNENKEAVAVLVGLGIIDGMGDGTFQPKGNLTRAQASKLVSVLVKSGDKTEIPAPTADPFTDVPKDHWAAGAIDYGVKYLYINGMGDGTFHPEDQVTTAQLATMLDKLLGFTVEDINLEWPDNAMAKANEEGLLIDVNKGATEALNREEAAQMLYNALTANMRVKTIVSGNNQPFYDTVRNNMSQDYRSRGRDSIQQLIEKYFPTVTWVTNDRNDAFGRPATVWKKDKKNITDEVVKEPTFVYTAREVSEITKAGDIIASDKIAEDLDGFVAEDGEVLINDRDVFAPGSYVEEDSDELIEYIASLTGYGTLVEVYTNEKNTEVDTVIVADYVADTVKSVNSRNGKISLSSTTNYEISPKDKFYSKVATAGQDDVVLVALNGNTVIDAYLPDSVANVAITEISNETKEGRQDYVDTIGGKAYTEWANLVKDWSSNAALGGNAIEVNADDTGTAYLDQYGYLAAYKKANNDASDWGLLMSVYTATADNEVGESSTDYNAVIVKEDGTIDYIPLLYKTSGDYKKAAEETVDIVDFFVGQNNYVGKGLSDVKQISDHNWFREEGILVAIKETGAGYKLSFDDFRNSEKSDGVELTGAYDKDDNNIDGIYLSSDLSVNTISGEKASELKSKTASKITKDLSAGDYKYVWKKIGNNKIITSVFIVKAAKDEILIKVNKIDSYEVAYGDAGLVGTKITYYTDDSSEPKTNIVSDESDPVWEGAFYKTSSLKDGMTITQAIAPAEKVVTWTTRPHNGDTAYGSSMTLGNQIYLIAENAEVIDRDECGINSVETLVNQIANTGANYNTDTISISFTWAADGQNRVVKQIYVDRLTSPQVDQDQSEE